MGALYGLFRADPWSGVTFDTGIPVEKSAQVANMIQICYENTRLGILGSYIGRMSSWPPGP